MPKGTRSGRVLVNSPPVQKGNGQATTSEVGNVRNQQRLEEGVVPRGIPVVEPATYQVHETQAVDWATEELLRASPFWALLIHAGYTWW